MAARHQEVCYENNISQQHPQQFLVCNGLGSTIDRSRLSGKVGRISGDTAGSWFQNRDFVKK